MRIVPTSKRINGVFPRRDNLKPITGKMLCTGIHKMLPLFPRSPRRFAPRPRHFALRTPHQGALPLRELPIRTAEATSSRTPVPARCDKGTKGLRVSR